MGARTTIYQEVKKKENEYQQHLDEKDQKISDLEEILQDFGLKAGVSVGVVQNIWAVW